MSNPELNDLRPGGHLSNYLVLRDVPKHLIQIDTVQMQISGGFRGFRSVPDGLHYVAVKTRDGDGELWGYVRNGVALIRVFDDTVLAFVADTPLGEAEYRQMALNGAMTGALLDYPLDDWDSWQSLTGAIINQSIQIEDDKYVDTLLRTLQDGWQVDISELAERSRFQQLLSDRFGGQAERLQAAFQFAFVHWLLSQERGQAEMSLACWQEMVLALCGCGEAMMRQYPQLIRGMGETLLIQLDYLPDEFFEADSFLMQAFDDFVVDLTDTAMPILSSIGVDLRAYVAA